MLVDTVIAAVGPGTTRYGAMGGRASGDGLRGVEFAGLLKGLLPHELDFAYAVYGQDLEAQVRLRAHAKVYAAGLAVKHGWETVRGRPTITNMASLAVFSVVSPVVCGGCRGSGVFDGFMCCGCNGVGSFPDSGRWMAAFVMVAESEWRRIWRDRYAMISGYVNDIGYVVSRTVSKNQVDVF